METARTVSRLIWCFGSLCAVACAFWAMRPAQSELRSVPVLEPPEAAAAAPQRHRPAFDREAFAARIWDPPAVPRALNASPSEVTEQPKPLKVELIAIIDEGNGLLRAAIYDIEADRTFVVGPGDRIAGHTVTRVADRAVELSNGATATRFVLREGRS